MTYPCFCRIRTLLATGLLLVASSMTIAAQSTPPQASKVLAAPIKLHTDFLTRMKTVIAFMDSVSKTSRQKWSVSSGIWLRVTGQDTVVVGAGTDMSDLTEAELHRRTEQLKKFPVVVQALKNAGWSISDYVKTVHLIGGQATLYDFQVGAGEKEMLGWSKIMRTTPNKAAFEFIGKHRAQLVALSFSKVNGPPMPSEYVLKYNARP